jgi:aspartyl protease family protein
MSEDQNIQFAWAAMAIILVGAGLIARRHSFGQLSKMAFAWIGIFVLAFAIASYRDSFKRVWITVKSEFLPGGTIDKDGSLRVKMAEDGHFWVDAQINGKPVRLMVDSGASETSIGTKDAAALGIVAARDGLVIPVETANGVVTAFPAKAEKLEVGPITRNDFGMLISDSFGDTKVIGMDFLSSLKSWRVEGRDLILNP